MRGSFRYAKSIICSLVMALMGFLLSYGQHWLFPEIGDLPEHRNATHPELHAGSGKSCSPMRTKANPHTATWDVAVVTNRLLVPVNDSERSGILSRDRSLLEQAAAANFAKAETTFGFTVVKVPDARVRGACPVQHGSPGCLAVGQRLQTSESDFHSRIRQLLASTESRDILIYIHGFNVTLAAATARAAQVAEDMPFDGVVVAFSWQSQGKAQAYLTDEQLAERNFWGLAELLADLKKRHEPEVRLHLLAHSMGNRVALRALNALAGSIGPTGTDVDPFLLPRLAQHRAAHSESPFPQSTATTGVLHWSDQIPSRFPDWGSWREGALKAPPLTNLILAAPDVDAAEFASFFRNVKHVSKRSVLYASKSDLALVASRKLHGNRFRAGESQAALDVDGLTIINVTSPGRIDPIGHSYYGSHPAVLSQLHALMRPTVRLAGDRLRLSR